MSAKRFVIKRRDQYELTTVGKTGQYQVHNGYPLDGKQPRGDFFTDEGSYRRAIKGAIKNAEPAPQ